MTTSHSHAASPQRAAELAPSCVSCGASLSGQYCAQCSEKVLASYDLEWRHYLLHELPESLIHADGKLPRTLTSLLARPGELAQAFVAGKRRGFIGPLKLYVAVFILYALTANFAGLADLSLPERARLTDVTHLLGPMLDVRNSTSWTEPALQKRIDFRAHWLSEAGTFLISVLLALVLQIILTRAHRRYLEHLALALNVSTFYLLVTSVAQLLIPWLAAGHAGEGESTLQTVLGFTLLPIYWYLSIRRFYGIPRLWASAAALAVTGGNALIAVVLNTVICAALIITSDL